MVAGGDHQTLPAEAGDRSCWSLGKQHCWLLPAQQDRALGSDRHFQMPTLKLEGIKSCSTGILFHPHLSALTHSHLIYGRVYFLINIFNISFLTRKTLLIFFFFFGSTFQKMI